MRREKLQLQVESFFFFLMTKEEANRGENEATHQEEIIPLVSSVTSSIPSSFLYYALFNPNR